MAGKRKALMELNLVKKKKILEAIDKGESFRSLAVKFGVSKSTIGNIKCNRGTILKSTEDNQSATRKRTMRKTTYEDVNNATLQFFKKCRAKNIPINGPMIQKKAKKFAEEMQIEGFKASNGWLESFRLRNNIQFRVLCGESANIDFEAANDWKEKLPDILQGFVSENQFNADETGLFYKQLPSKSLVEKSDKCKGGKMAKERLSVLLCCSATGEKLKPLVIGKSACPRVFKQNKIDPSSDNFLANGVPIKKHG